MYKKEVLVDSVKKLIELKVPEKQIIDNLKDVGLTEREAKEVLMSARESVETSQTLAGLPKMSGEKTAPGQEIMEKAFEEKLGLVGYKRRKSREEEMGFDKPKADETFSGEKKKDGITDFVEPETGRFAQPVEYKGLQQQQMQDIKQAIPEDVQAPKPMAMTRPQAAADTGKEMAELWQRGILAAVDMKLEEVKKIKNELDRQIEAKVKEVIEKELTKMHAVMASQQKLFAAEIKSSLEGKADEVTELIDVKVDEIKKMNELSQKTLSELEARKAKNEELIAAFDSRMDEITNMKLKLSAEMNTTIVQAKTRVDELVSAADAKINEAERRITQTLDLESKAAEGLLNNAKLQINQMIQEQTNELIRRIDSKLAEMDALKVSVSAETINTKLAEMEAFKQEMNAKNETQIMQAIKAKIPEFTALMEQELQKVRDLQKQIDVNKFNTMIEEMNLFKEQFVKVIQKNVQEFNAAKKEMAEAIQAREKAIDEQLAKIDLKMNELTEFEKNFAKEMGLTLDKLTLTKDKKSGKAKKKKK